MMGKGVGRRPIVRRWCETPGMCKPMALAGAGFTLFWSLVAVEDSRAQTGSEEYGLLMAIAGVPAHCRDGNSNPEPYGTVQRSDPETWGQIDELGDRIEVIVEERMMVDERIAGVSAAEREPLSDEAVALLSSLRAERRRLEADASALRGERSALLALVRLVALRQRYRELTVYVGDELSVRLMESDVFSDDTCGSWRVRLDRAVLEHGSLALGNGQQTYVVLVFAPRS